MRGHEWKMQWQTGKTQKSLIATAKDLRPRPRWTLRATRAEVKLHTHTFTAHIIRTSRLKNIASEISSTPSFAFFSAALSFGFCPVPSLSFPISSILSYHIYIPLQITFYAHPFLITVSILVKMIFRICYMIHRCRNISMHIIKLSKPRNSHSFPWHYLRYNTDLNKQN